MIPSDLADIPFVDLRDGGPVLQAEHSAARARALRDDCLSFFPGATALLLPALDALARRWLVRSRSPYIGEIERIAGGLGFSGVWFLNGSYQWGCTALSRVEGGQPWLVRSLDWPFPGLGRHVEIAHKRGPAGDFHSVTWPGYVGTLTGMAAGRFAACINQAPLRRRTRHPWLRLFDLAANAVATWSVRHIPPDQFLRQVFETCSDFAAARHALETTPVARPVIFSLVGTKESEACVIERTEDGFVTHAGGGSAANDWQEPRPAWEARVGGDMLLSSRFDEAAANSRARQEALLAYRGSLQDTPFAWLREPVLNRYTRLGVEMCPARGLLRVTGYEPQATGAPASAVTRAAMLENLAV
jgi:hypothetical protein